MHCLFIYNDHSNTSIIAYSVARQVTKCKLLCPRSAIAINYIMYTYIMYTVSCKFEATYRTFSYHAILIWNYLSKLICTNITLACFKKRSLVYLQTHLIPYRTVR